MAWKLHFSKADIKRYLILVPVQSISSSGSSFYKNIHFGKSNLHLWYVYFYVYIEYLSIFLKNVL